MDVGLSYALIFGDRVVSSTQYLFWMLHSAFCTAMGLLLVTLRQHHTIKPVSNLDAG